MSLGDYGTEDAQGAQSEAEMVPAIIAKKDGKILTLASQLDAATRDGMEALSKQKKSVEDHEREVRRLRQVINRQQEELHRAQEMADSASASLSEKQKQISDLRGKVDDAVAELLAERASKKECIGPL